MRSARDGIPRRAIRVMSDWSAEWDVQETLIARLRREAEVPQDELLSPHKQIRVRVREAVVADDQIAVVRPADEVGRNADGASSPPRVTADNLQLDAVIGQEVGRFAADARARIKRESIVVKHA